MSSRARGPRHSYRRLHDPRADESRQRHRTTARGGSRLASGHARSARVSAAVAVPPARRSGPGVGKQFASENSHRRRQLAAWEAPVALASRFYTFGLPHDVDRRGASLPSQESAVSCLLRGQITPVATPIFHSTPGVGPSRLAGEAIRHEPKTRHPSPFLRTPSAPPAAATQPYAPISLQSARQNRQNRQNRPCAS
jgi:hypothetical protein